MKDNRLLGVDEDSRGYSCYFYKHNKTKDCCAVGQANTYRDVRIFAAVVINALVLLFFFGVPLCICSYLTRSGEPHSDVLYYKWAFCIMAFLVSTSVFVFLISNVKFHYDEASAEDDVKVYYFLAISLFVGLPIADFLYTALIVTKMLNFSSLLNASFIKTCAGITITTYLLQQMTFCGYNMLLAAIASPVHTCPLLLLYICSVVLFVLLITVLLKYLHKRLEFESAQIVLVTLPIALVIVCLFVVFRQLITLVGEYNTDGGIMSVIGNFFPAILLATIGYFTEKIIRKLGVQNMRQSASKTKQSHKRRETVV